MRRKLLVFIFILSISIVSCNKAGVQELSMKQKIEDFEYMYSVIEEGYPFLDVNKRLNNIDWLDKKEVYLERIKVTKNDEEFIAALSLILNELNNDHTNIIDDQSFFLMCKEVYKPEGWYKFFDDSKVVNRYESLKSENTNSNNQLSGKELILKDVVKDKIAYMHIAQMAPMTDSIEEDMVIIEEYIKGLDNHESLIIDIRGNTGGKDAYWMSIVSKLIKSDMERKGLFLFRDSKVINDYTKKRGLDKKYTKELSEEIIKNAPEEISEKFKYYKESNIIIENSPASNFNGRIYLLVDEMVYSSSESFAIFSKETNFATLIGTTTGGDGGGIDPVLFNLKNSGLVVKMSSDMYLTESGVCNEEFKTNPDFIMEDSKRTDNFNDDNCINKVLELEGI